MQKEILEQAIKDVEKLAEDFLASGSEEGVAKVALEAIQKIAEMALKNQ